MRLTIGQKLGLGFGIVLLLMVICSLVVYQALERINASSTVMTQSATPGLRACDDLLISINRATAVTRGMLLLSPDSKQGADFRKEMDTSLDDVQAALTRLKAVYSDPGDITSLDAYNKILQSSDVYLTTQQAVRNAALEAEKTPERDLQAAITLLETGSVPASREIRLAAEQLKDSAVRQMDQVEKSLKENQISAKSTLLITTVLALLLGLGLSIALTRSLVTSIRSLLDGVRMVAEGNLTQAEMRVSSSDEIGELMQGFNQMVVSLRTILSETTTATTDVATASGQIATGAQQQLASLNQTATSLNEITTTAEEFKATMQEFADRAKAVHEAADETARRATEGYSLSKDSAIQIEKVRENSLSAGESVLHLAEQMQRIGEITASVNEIAEQTKLLALNASIEAARAGEEGRGFAVVAMQVRELANQSKEAAGRIEGLITQTQKSMQSVVGKIEDGGRLSEDSTSKVRNVTVAFDEIAKAIDQTRQAMAQINTGARQQELGITELVSSIVEIDSASKEAVAAAEQTQQSILSIDRRLRTLNGLIGRFKT
ncbi:methyl-accepting chemotaxis protein [Planctomicrobium sp. SH661]|uniref:methyl-accepting chemotaxis protein n=1 Tax=Planctomicrobium sp. SH661 TaxID=3448124 RepID=UPI003F5B87D3